jgi:hypothetical protein
MKFCPVSRARYNGDVDFMNESIYLINKYMRHYSFASKTIFNLIPDGTAFI